MHEQYVKWYTPNLSRDFEMLTFGHAGRPLIIFPTSQGRYHEVKDFHLVNSIRWYVEQGLVKVYCPDAIDAQSWYNRSIHPADKIKTHLAYERVIVQEVFHRARVETSQSHVMLCGASFGGFHALSMGLKYPQQVSHLISMSGSCDIRNFLDGYFDENAYFTNPIDFIGGCNSHEQLEQIRRMNIILACSGEDVLKEMNFNFHHLLQQKGIPHWFDFQPNSRHDWEHWRVTLPTYLSQVHYH